MENCKSEVPSECVADLKRPLCVTLEQIEEEADWAFPLGATMCHMVVSLSVLTRLGNRSGCRLC